VARVRAAAHHILRGTGVAAAPLRDVPRVSPVAALFRGQR